MTLVQTIEIENEQVRGWRSQQLHELGMSDEQVLFLLERHVDWHEVERLRGKGCPPDLVLEILT